MAKKRKKYEHGKRVFAKAYSLENIIKNEENALIVKCSNNTFLIYEYTPYTATKGSITLLWTDDLKKESYRYKRLINLTTIVDPIIRECIFELVTRVQVARAIGNY